MRITRHADDERRASEIQKQAGVLRHFDAIPSVKQLRNNQVVFVVGTGIVVRRGNHLYDATDTLIS